MHVHIPTLSSAYTRVGAAAGRPHSNRERADEPPPPPPVPPLVPSSAMAAAEAAQCRFCFEGESETDADADGTGAGPLVAPCRCAGSLKHVHLRQGPTLSPLVQIRGGCGSCGSCGGCGFVPHTQSPDHLVPNLYLRNAAAEHARSPCVAALNSGVDPKELGLKAEKARHVERLKAGGRPLPELATVAVLLWVVVSASLTLHQVLMPGCVLRGLYSLTHFAPGPYTGGYLASHHLIVCAWCVGVSLPSGDREGEGAARGPRPREDGEGGGARDHAARTGSAGQILLATPPLPPNPPLPPTPPPFAATATAATPDLLPAAAAATPVALTAALTAVHTAATSSNAFGTLVS